MLHSKTKEFKLIQDLEWRTKYAFKNYGYGSDEPRAGWDRLPVQDVIEKRYIRTNPSKLTSMLVVDVDKPQAESYILSAAWDDETIPEPNWITTNTATEHAHAGFWLAEPVTTSDAGSERARRLLYDMQKKLTLALDGDRYYSNYVTRSPFHPGHVTNFVRSEPHSLTDMAETLKQIKLLPTFKIDTVQGRNVTIFNTVRERAYRIRYLYAEYSAFWSAVLDIAIETNLRMPTEQLPETEIRSIARSIAAWTWKMMGPNSFSNLQRSRANRRWTKVNSGDVTGEKRLNRLNEERSIIMSLHASGMTHREIGNVVGLSKDQVKSRVQYAKKMFYET